MFVSFVAMSTSGLLMIVMDRTSFTLQMHPVHKVFGLLMVATALVGLYAMAMNNSVPAETAASLDALSHKAEQQMEGQ